jgi:mannosyltransferase OCH1-like enzyme
MVFVHQYSTEQWAVTSPHQLSDKIVMLRWQVWDGKLNGAGVFPEDSVQLTNTWISQNTPQWTRVDVG